MKSKKKENNNENKVGQAKVLLDKFLKENNLDIQIVPITYNTKVEINSGQEVDTVSTAYVLSVTFKKQQEKK